MCPVIRKILQFWHSLNNGGGTFNSSRARGFQPQALPPARRLWWPWWCGPWPLLLWPGFLLKHMTFSWHLQATFMSMDGIVHHVLPSLVTITSSKTITNTSYLCLRIFILSFPPSLSLHSFLSSPSVPLLPSFSFLFQQFHALFSISLTLQLVFNPSFY